MPPGNAATAVTFFGWEGWTFVGTVAQVLALLAVAGAIWRWVSQRRRVPPIFLQWIPIGRQLLDGQWWHILEVRNLGSGIAHIMHFEIYGALAHPGVESSLPVMMGSGGSHRVLITAPSLEACWVRMVTRSPTDQMLITVAWGPLMLTGSLADRWREARVAERKESWWKRRARVRRPDVVAPHGMLSATVRAKRSSVETLDPRIVAAFADVKNTPVATLSGASIVLDLPYLGRD